jgi:hypothetical protein
MTRLPLHTFLFIVVALSLVSAGAGGAMARVAMATAGSGGTQIVICGAQGAEVIILPGAPAPTYDCDLCPACHMAAPGLAPDMAQAGLSLRAGRVTSAPCPVSQHRPRPTVSRLARAPPEAT